jgi:hypothetical protein
LGQNATNASHIQGNTIYLRTALDFGGAGNIALQVFGANNTIDLEVFGPNQSVGARLEVSSSGNLLTYGPVNATTPIINLGTGNTLVARATAAAMPLVTASFTTNQTTGLTSDDGQALDATSSNQATRTNNARSAAATSAGHAKPRRWRPLLEAVDGAFATFYPR